MAKMDPIERAQLMWTSYLTGDTSDLEPAVMMVRKIWARMPSDPRCKVCMAPFLGLGGRAASLLGFGAGKSRFNPYLCDRCEKVVREHQVGAEVELTMLFADIRGSTSLAEKLGPTEFHKVINRFYKASTDILVATDALIDKLVGDEVVALYTPGIAGENFAGKAVSAARRMLVATGHEDPDGPWISIGIGIHTGVVYIGAVGTSHGVNDLTVFGDPANITARLASGAGPGEILVSDETCRKIGLDPVDCETRTLEIKGRSEPVGVHVLDVLRPELAL